MDNSRWDPNAQLVCPYDSFHIISVKRYQHHIIKCRKNHADKDFVACPFNAKHMVIRHELKTHLAHCADRVILERDINRDECPETGEILRLKGNTDMPEAQYDVPDATEDWDDEIEESIATKYEEQKISVRRKYEENGHALRRPNAYSDVPNTPNSNPLITSSYVSKNNDGTSSVCSQSSSGRSSLYVNPVRHPPERNNSNTPYSIDTHSSKNSLNNTKTIGTGRGALIYVSNRQTSNENPVGRSVNEDNKMQGVGGQPVGKNAFGRGIVRQTLLNFHKESR